VPHPAGAQQHSKVLLAGDHKHKVFCSSG
jgi:hypothetical protein